MIFVAATSGSQLKNRYIEEIESGLQDQSSRAGVTLKQMLQRSDPVREKECNNINCLVFSTGGKGPCRSTGVTYELVCQLCRQKSSGKHHEVHTPAERNTIFLCGLSLWSIFAKYYFLVFFNLR